MERPSYINKVLATLVFFSYEILWRNSDGVRLNGERRMDIKNRDLRPISQFMSETMLDTVDCQ